MHLFRKITLAGVLAGQLAMPGCATAPTPRPSNAFKTSPTLSNLEAITMAAAQAQRQDPAQSAQEALQNFKEFCWHGDNAAKVRFTKLYNANKNETNFKTEFMRIVNADGTLNQLFGKYKEYASDPIKPIDVFKVVVAVQNTFTNARDFADMVEKYGHTLPFYIASVYAHKEDLPPVIAVLADPTKPDLRSRSLELLRRFETSPEMIRFFSRYRYLGTVETTALEVTPELWSLVRDKVAEILGPELERDPDLLTVFNYIFANQRTYTEFLQQTSDDDKRRFIINLLTTIVPIGGQATDPTAPAPAVSITTPSAIEVAGATRVATKFLGAWKSVKFNLDELNKLIMQSPLLTKHDKIAYSQMFSTLYLANTEMATAFLLTVYSALASAPPGRPFDAVFPDRIKHLLTQMGGIWGKSLENYFKTQTEPDVTKISAFGRYINTLYANLSLGAVLVNGMPKPMRAYFGRAFMIGFVGGLTGIIDDTFVQNFAKLNEAATKSLTDADGNVTSGLMSPAMATIALSAGLVTSVMQNTITRPLGAAYQAFLANIGSKVAKELVDAAKGDRERRLRDPLVVASVFAPIAVYGHNEQGMIGIFLPTTDIAGGGTGTSGGAPVPAGYGTVATPQKGEAAQAGVTAAGPTAGSREVGAMQARDVLDTNIIDMLKTALEIADREEYVKAEDVYAGLVGLQALSYSVKAYSLQEVDTSFWDRIFGDDIDEDFINAFKKTAKDPVKLESLFKLIKQINDAGQIPMDEIMKTYEKKGLPGLEKMLENAEKKGSIMVVPKKVRYT